MHARKACGLFTPRGSVTSHDVLPSWHSNCVQVVGRAKFLAAEPSSDSVDCMLWLALRFSVRD